MLQLRSKRTQTVDCRSKPGQFKESAACQLLSPSESVHSDDVIDDHGSKAPGRVSWPTVAVVSNHEETYIKDMQYPLSGIAKVSGKRVRFLRDTGSSICLASENFVGTNEYTGTSTTVLLADRCVRQIPDAIIQVEIPEYKGPLKVSVMKNPVSDLIIGNNWFNETSAVNNTVDILDESDPEVDSGTLIFENSEYQEPLITIPVKQTVFTAHTVKDDQLNMSSLVFNNSVNNFEVGDASDKINHTVINSDEEHINEITSRDQDMEISVAVQTREQTRQETKFKRPLKVTVIDALNISPDDL